MNPEINKLTRRMFGKQASDELSSNALFDAYCMVTLIREGCGREELVSLVQRLDHELTKVIPDESNDSSERRIGKIARVGMGDPERGDPFLQLQSQRATS